MDCEQIQEYLEEYVLGLLEPDLHRQVEEHLAGCPTCRARVQEYGEVLGDLPQVLLPISLTRLPERVKLDVLAEVERRRQRTDSPMLPAGDVLSVPAGMAPDRKTRQETTGREQRSTSVRASIWRLRLAVIAAVMLLVLSVAWSIRLTGVLARERALRAEFSNLVDQQELVLEVIDSNQTERRVLLPPGGDSRAYGKVFTRSDMPYVVAMAARLPQPPAGQAYHLWLTHNGSTELAGTLNTNEEGFGLLVYEAPAANLAYESALITLQDEGSDVPVTPPVLVWEAGE